MNSVVATTDHVIIASRAPDLRIMRLFNPVMRALLRSPLHGLLSKQLLLLTYTGRRSGRQYTLPVGYMRDDDALLVVSQHSELKQWWRNLRGGAPVAVLVRGQRVSARADVIEDPAAVAAEVERLIARLGAKEASRELYMSLDFAPPPTREQLTQALHGVVVVRIIPERPARFSKIGGHMYQSADDDDAGDKVVISAHSGADNVSTSTK